MQSDRAMATHTNGADVPIEDSEASDDARANMEIENMKMQLEEAKAAQEKMKDTIDELLKMVSDLKVDMMKWKRTRRMKWKKDETVL